MDQAKVQQVKQIISKMVDPTISNQERQSTESQFFQLMNHDPSNIFFCLTSIYIDKTAPANLRMVAATTLRNSLLAKTDKEAPYWLMLQDDLVEYIKQSCLRVPFDDDQILTNIGCQINGTLYAIEIGLRGWAQLLSQLVNLMKDDVANVDRYRLVGITTLRSICDLVATKNLPIPDEERSHMVAAIFMSIRMEQTNTAVKIEGFQTVSQSIGFYKQFLERNQSSRDFLFEQFVKHMEAQPFDVIREAYDALIES